MAMLRLGDMVEIFGLESAIELNGQIGKIVKESDSIANRYSVKVEGMTGKMIKEDNLRLHLVRNSRRQELTYNLRFGKGRYHKDVYKWLSYQKKNTVPVHIAKLLHKIDQYHGPDNTFGSSDHHILYMNHAFGDLCGFLLPEDQALWERECANRSVSAEYQVYPASERMVYKCNGRMFSVQYHVFGQHWELCPKGALNTKDGQPFLGDMLALAMTSDLLPLKQGWRSDSIVVYAELELMLCAGCHQPAVEVCAGCKRICYCGAVCQRDDWKRHKPLCKEAAAIKDACKTDELNTWKECSSEVRDKCTELQCLAECGDWSLVYESLRSVPHSLQKDLCGGLMISQKMLDLVLESVYTCRDLEIVLTVVKILRWVLEWDGLSWCARLSRHHRLFEGLVSWLREGFTPLKKELYEVWCLLSRLCEHGDQRHIALCWKKADFTAFLIEQFSTIESSFHKFVHEESGILFWLMPVITWGRMANCLDEQKMIKIQFDLYDSCVVEALSRIVDLMASCKPPFHTVISPIGFMETYQALCNVAFHEEFGAFQRSLRFRLRNNRLIRQYAGMKCTGGRGGMSFSCSPDGDSSVVDVDLNPEISLLHFSGRRGYKCEACREQVDTPFMCSRCGQMPYCSIQCEQQHKSKHALVCPGLTGGNRSKATAQSSPCQDANAGQTQQTRMSKRAKQKARRAAARTSVDEHDT